MSERVKQVKFFYEKGIVDPQVIACALSYDVDGVAMIVDSLQEAEKNKSMGRLGAKLDGNTPEQVYKDNHLAVSRRLVTLALDDRDEMAGISAKAALYINEEATGRNEAKAKKVNNTILLNIGDALLSLKQAAMNVDKSLDNAHLIDI